MEVKSVDAGVELQGATLVAGVIQGLAPAPGSETALDAIDSEMLEATGFEGKSGQIIALPHPEAAALLLVGLGEEVDFDSLREVSGNAVRIVKTERLVTLLATCGVDHATRAVAEGSLLGGFQFRTYKTGNDALKVAAVEIVGADEDELASATVAAEATNLAREWVNTPARDLSPEAFAARIAEVARDTGLDVAIWEKPKIEEEKLGAILGVAAGSDRDPRVVTLEYKPAKSSVHLGLVGKGITFDSGGLSIKPSASMEEMKVDMAGAAVVVAATIAMARLGLPIRITCITPLTDNAIGGDATRPGDVLTPVEGPTIEVLNTDAEGRLILADGLGLVRRHQPDLIVDVATLTGASRVALGDKISAVFGSSRDVAARVLEAASKAGESFWEMPLAKEYRKSLDSNIADIKNITGSRYGGAIAAALFLSEYAGDGDWAHLDIAGPAVRRETAGDQVKGASGVGVRTLVELGRALALVD